MPSDTASQSPLLEFRNVSYQIPAPAPHPILHNISFQLQSGERLSLLGKSGSGKTTLLKLINRLRDPTSGEISVEGRLTKDWDPIRLRRTIGYVIQEIGLFPHLTIEQNVSLVPSLELWPKPRIAKRYDEVMQLVGLDPREFARRKPRQLSGGQRQRVGVARALAVDPPILLMDEPFGALDPVTRAELQRDFAELVGRLQKTIVLVTHDVREALLLGTRIILLEDGRIAADAPAGEFTESQHASVKEFVDSSQIVSGDTR
jgi:osmoprotectant transport system ATP-binding protein